MSRIKKLVIGGVIIALAGLVLFYLAQDLTEASLESFTVTSISDLSTESFTFTADLAITNPSLIPVPVRTVEYELVLEETDEIISERQLMPFVLSASTTSSIDVEQDVRWQPAADLATQLLTQDEVYMIVSGTARLNLPFLSEHEIPFEDRVDIKEFIEEQPVVGDASQAVDETRNAVETASGGAISDLTEDLFS